LPSKTFNKIFLLYVGTITSRNIDQTVTGLYEYLKGSAVEKEAEYYIVGGGIESDVIKLKGTIIKTGLDKIVHYVGPVYGENLNHYFEICNIGVSYIPITKDYDCQPPTKTIEYLMAGMPVIATSTYENQKLISSSNGILINDSPGSFAEGLKKIFNSRDSFNSEKIIESVKDCSYETIIRTKLIPLLTKR
jgi:glycosyltransferase involved in cell wall biosynthesis